jgi:hypothetical protein
MKWRKAHQHFGCGRVFPSGPSLTLELSAENINTNTLNRPNKEDVFIP